ncbi:MAG: type I-C CRISPR-associated protein Cas8c/Csd1 [Firmicutes bacterium]|nr:type I-C CRISPR-associated protein Cas8c/Csd1 [Bacillota bacterium]
MILSALTRYYEAMAEKGELERPGWDKDGKVSFALKIDDDGELLDIASLMEPITVKGKSKLVPCTTSVPAHEVRTVGIKAFFLCDNSSYLLGVDDKGKPARAKECFEAAQRLHHEILDGIDTPAAKAVLAFFDNWNPDIALENRYVKEHWDEISKGKSANFIFHYHGSQSVIKDKEVANAWQQYYDSSDFSSDDGLCLVTGKKTPIQLVHPSIKGLMGAQTSGAALVSFNAPAFESYGNEGSQGKNAPVGKYAAYAYTSALNSLLADKEHCRYVGDTAVLCWSEHGDKAYQDAAQAAFSGYDADNDAKFGSGELKMALKRLSRGETYEWEGFELSPDEHFYILGLAPNAARISVRFFIEDSFGKFAKNIMNHYERLEIIKPEYDKREMLTPYLLLNETVNRKERNPSPKPRLSGDLLQAILTDGRYPATLLNAATLRIRAEKNVTRGRAAIIKAYYLKNENIKCPKEVLTVELNEQTEYLPYVLGRLFAVLEEIQQKANPGINATIKDKYFNSASATPSAIIPLLINLSEKHMRKIDGGSKIYLARKKGKIMSMIHETYPSRMTLAEQGAFQLGYYHETQARYKTKEDK